MYTFVDLNWLLNVHPLAYLKSFTMFDRGAILFFSDMLKAYTLIGLRKHTDRYVIKINGITHSTSIP